MTSPSASDPVTIARAHERLLVQRLLPFALAWLGEAVLWTGVLVIESDVSLPAAGLVLAVQLALVGAMVATGRSRWAGGRLVFVLVACCVVLGLSVIATFAVARADVDFLGFILLTLFFVSSLSFAWGWRPALAVLAVTTAAWVWFLPRAPEHGPAPQLSGAAVIGAVLSLGIAEVYWRSFVAGLRYEAERDAVRARERAALADAKSARRGAEAATRAKDRFLAVVSHELRSPLAAALNWAFILRRRQDDRSQVARAVDGVEGSIHLAVRLIEDLLDVARATQGKLALEMAEVDFRAVVSAVVDAARFAAQEKGITLEVTMPDDPVPVHGDAGRLRQVVDNLVSNAVKFTPRAGRIDVALRVESPDVTLVVQDSGIGIAAEVLPDVFEPFHQGGGREGLRQGGLGLGLAVVRHLVQAHGGSVDAASEGAGHGATFRVRLPAAPAAEAERGASPVLDRLRILLVDEEARAREFIRALLERCGAEVVSVATVGEALDALGVRRPDVLIADVVVHRAAGSASIATLRQAGAGVPSIVFGADIPSDERRQLVDAGFDVCVGSSDPAALVAAVAKVAGAGRAARERPT